MTEPIRHWLYIGAAALIAVLIVVDVARGGDVANWVTWIMGVLGLGGAGMAALNTSADAVPEPGYQANLAPDEGGSDE